MTEERRQEDRTDLAHTVITAARAAQQRVYHMGPQGWYVDGNSLTFGSDGRPLGHDRVFEALEGALLDTMIFAAVLRAKLRLTYAEFDPDKLWAQRVSAKPRPRMGQKPPLRGRKEWLTADRYFEAYRTSAYIFSCVAGEVTHDGHFIAGAQKRRRIQGWRHTVEAAARWLGGESL